VRVHGFHAGDETARRSSKGVQVSAFQPSRELEGDGRADYGSVGSVLDHTNGLLQFDFPVAADAES
jgi:hypothetical protein